MKMKVYDIWQLHTSRGPPPNALPWGLWSSTHPWFSRWPGPSTSCPKALAGPVLLVSSAAHTNPPVAALAAPPEAAALQQQRATARKLIRGPHDRYQSTQTNAGYMYGWPSTGTVMEITVNYIQTYEIFICYVDVTMQQTLWYIQ